jgi:hypothetical protein
VGLRRVNIHCRWSGVDESDRDRVVDRIVGEMCRDHRVAVTGLSDDDWFSVYDESAESSRHPDSDPHFMDLTTRLSEPGVSIGFSVRDWDWWGCVLAWAGTGVATIATPGYPSPDAFGRDTNPPNTYPGEDPLKVAEALLNRPCERYPRQKELVE